MSLYNNDVSFESKKLLANERQGEVFDLEQPSPSNSRKFYIESYGCAMNFSDSEIVASVLASNGFSNTTDITNADLVLINTCSIREKAEAKVRKRLEFFNSVKKNKPAMLIGVLGCMAERLKTKFLDEEKMVDIVVGPDAYRDLPKLVAQADGGQKAVNVFLSREETYADISPVRLDSNGVCAYISIMRGCDNMCSFCVVPFTRGRERSRDPQTIVSEARDLFEKGYKEVTLLGQNVDSFKFKQEETGETTSFAGLLAMVGQINPALRVRFSTSHPKDITNEVLHTIAKYPNICNNIHLPIQSGSSRLLKMMNRTYDAQWYKNKIDAIKTTIPDCGISTDIITGFCTETEEDLQETLSIMDFVRFDYSFMFFYSERPGTLAAKKYTDDVPLEVKKSRLQTVVDLQRAHSLENNKKDIGKSFEVLIEKNSKKTANHLAGRTSHNKMVIFPKENYQKGDYVIVEVNQANSATLFGKAIKQKSK